MRHAFVVLLAAPMLVVSLATGAEAAGGGWNHGTAGVVYDAVTIEGVTISGACAYHSDPTGITVTGTATAASTRLVASTELRCTVHTAFTLTWTRNGAGPAVSMAGSSRVPGPGTSVCIEMTAHMVDGSEYPTAPFCA